MRFRDISRINRNIVECKEYGKSCLKIAVIRINRNIVECKENTVFTGICAIFVLIETSWNVKVIFKSCIIFPSSINRNIVECKAYFPASIQTAISSINRNIVECKASNFKDSINESVVLIETSWNVKVPTGVEIIGYLYVLIETSCNVKESAESTRLFPDRVLIETSWNVKSIAKDRFSKVAMVLIETSWNVKTIAEVNRIKNISY